MPFFGERLREERERLGLSQQELADLCGVTMRSQRNYEKGERQPDTSYLEPFAQAGGDLLYIITGQTLKPPPVKPVEIDLARLARIIDMLEDLAKRAKRRWPARDLAVIAAEVYNVLVEDEELDEVHVGRILKLVVNR
ncbi:helix-turn-helix transcriptional regulator [Pseudomonas syringae]|uniref:helix-turn-helix domain-containing protein n=1 Tax=Pseudomonas syringae TaxID=317 RepID=UPI000F00DAD6|nr:helix-turn-helix transcriptional regulator [Pseudomonas azotoformans]